MAFISLLGLSIAFGGPVRAILIWGIVSTEFMLVVWPRFFSVDASREYRAVPHPQCDLSAGGSVGRAYPIDLSRFSRSKEGAANASSYWVGEARRQLRDVDFFNSIDAEADRGAFSARGAILRQQFEGNPLHGIASRVECADSLDDKPWIREMATRHMKGKLLLGGAETTQPMRANLTLRGFTWSGDVGFEEGKEYGISIRFRSREITFRLRLVAGLRSAFEAGTWSLVHAGPFRTYVFGRYMRVHAACTEFFWGACGITDQKSRL